MDDKSKFQENVKRVREIFKSDPSKTTSVNETYSSNGEQTKQTSNSKNKIPSDKKLTIFGIALLVLVGVAMIFAPKTEAADVSASVKSALSEQVSTSLSAGAILLTNDEKLTAKDYTITHSSEQDDTKIWVWDYAAEDGDYVQVIVNGVPLGDAFFIKNKPVELTVPSVALIQVKGVRDGGGGITYAVMYELNQTTYFNSAPIDGVNSYRLVRQ